MADIRVEDLFNLHRFRVDWWLAVCVLYAPLGIVLATVRLFVCVQAVIASLMLQNCPRLRSVVLRVMCAVLGVWVRCERQSSHHPSSSSSNYTTTTGTQQGRLLVANSISRLDGVAVQLTTPECFTVCTSAVPAIMQYVLQYRALHSAEAVKQAVLGGVGVGDGVGNSPSCLLLQPEETTTNGHVGLLKFSSRLIAAGLDIEPVSVTAWRPLPFSCVALTTLDSSGLGDLLYVLFVPCTVFTVRFLDVVEHNTAEDVSVLLERVRSSVADSISLRCTKFTSADKMELLKLVRSRYAGFSRAAAAAASTRASRPPPLTSSWSRDELPTLAARAQDVLPHVPLAALMTDLRRTRCVDQTIVNMLESGSSHGPSQSGSSHGPSLAAQDQTTPAPTERDGATAVAGRTAMYTGDTVFASRSSQRHLSFEQRKQRLLESARRVYLAKHGH